MLSGATMERLDIQNQADLNEALSNHGTTPSLFLGEILIDQNSITKEQLEAALERQKKEPGHHLGELLIDMGFTVSEQINIALGRKLGIPYVKLNEFEVDQEAITLLPSDIALQYNVLPLAYIGKRLIVATENPFDWEAMDVVRFHVNCNVEMVLSSATDISTALNRHYSRFNEEDLLDELEPSSKHDLDKLDIKADDLHAPIAIAEQEAMKKPIVRMLNAILLQAVIRKASDINIRPEKNKVSIYYRIDGKIQFVRSLHKSLLLPLVSRVKIIAKMDIAERRLPQDGHARLTHLGNTIDLRMSVMPTVNGESVVVRLLDKEVGLKNIDEIGFAQNDLDDIRQILSKSYGMFLVTGPTGSGKSTTLYGVLNEITKRNPHVITVEDPVEYNIESVEQINISENIGYTFAEALRHILRHDPDVVMIGEIRDSETVQIANKAALTGHLVLSTLHTNDAASSITRLVDMGVEPYLVANTILGVMAQRLVRVNCPDCLEEEKVDSSIKRQLKITAKDKFYRGAGCASCDHTGYKGRTIVYELLSVSHEISDLIRKSQDSQQIKECAISQGMRTLTQCALDLAREGKTSIEEVYATRLE
jgi:type IV pilus assembly protein PilB